MIIDNKKDRYPNDGYHIKTVWDFIKTFAGHHINCEEESTGTLDIVTGYFTYKSLKHIIS